MIKKIIAIADRYPEFIEYQYASVKKYAVGKPEYIVFNNAADSKIRDEINNTCNKLKIKSHELLGNYGGHSSPIHAEAMNTIWDKYLKEETGSVLWIDGDMFLISKIDIEELAKNYDIGYSPIFRDGWNIECMWTGVLFFNLDTISKDIDFSITHINGYDTDTAGMTYYYLKKYPDYRKMFFGVDSIYDFNDKELKTALNGCSGYVNFVDNIPDREPIKRLFPYEEEDDNYWEKYRLRFETHKNIIKKYLFPKPYDLDLIRIEGKNKPFLFHYKSASWAERYGDGTNEHSINKKESLRKLLDIK